MALHAHLPLYKTAMALTVYIETVREDHFTGEYGRPGVTTVEIHHESKHVPHAHFRALSTCPRNRGKTTFLSSRFSDCVGLSVW